MDSSNALIDGFFVVLLKYLNVLVTEIIHTLDLLYYTLVLLFSSFFNQLAVVLAQFT